MRAKFDCEDYVFLGRGEALTMRSFVTYAPSRRCFAASRYAAEPDRRAALRARPRTPSAPEVNMFVLVRAVTYAALFIGLLLIYVSSNLLSWSGIVRPAAIQVQQVAGMVLGAAGAAVALWCIFTFASIGRGTLAPFDLPRRVVIQDPCRFVRNPMYIGAGLALASRGAVR